MAKADKKVLTAEEREDIREEAATLFQQHRSKGLSRRKARARVLETMKGKFGAKLSWMEILKMLLQLFDSRPQAGKFLRRKSTSEVMWPNSSQAVAFLRSLRQKTAVQSALSHTRPTGRQTEQLTFPWTNTWSKRRSQASRLADS